MILQILQSLLHNDFTPFYALNCKNLNCHQLAKLDLQIYLDLGKIDSGYLKI